MKNFKYIILFPTLVFCLIYSFTVFSQELSQSPTPPKNDENQPAKESSEESESQMESETSQSEEGYTNLQGDIITLKSGKKMYGVQVLRELPDKIEVQVKEGMEPLVLPRRLIQSIQYDNIDPLRSKIFQEVQGQSKNEGVIPGEELSQEFNQKMKAPLSDQPLVYQNIGILKLLAELTQKVGVGLEVDESMKSMPMEQRIKSFEIPPGTSLYKFLQTDFANAYPQVSITYKFDKIHISLKNVSQ